MLVPVRGGILTQLESWCRSYSIGGVLLGLYEPKQMLSILFVKGMQDGSEFMLKV